jgi:hypothetical protein
MYRHLTSNLMLILLYLMIGGCSAIFTYPDKWGQRIKKPDNECPDISGVYYNQGFTQTKIQNYLYDKITSEGVLGTHECTDCPVFIEWLDKNQNDLHIQLFKRDKKRDWILEEETILKRTDNDFICSEGAIEIKYTEVREQGFTGLYEWGTRSFSITVDGEIILEEASEMIGHTWVIIPLSFTTRDYSIWKRTDSLPEKYKLLQAYPDNDSQQ